MSGRDAELAVIGCCMEGASCELTSGDFGSKDLQKVYEAIETMTLERKKIDLITLDAQTGSVMTDTLAEALQVGFMPSMIKAYSAIVRENTIRRRVYDIARSMSDDSIDTTTDITASIESAKKQLADIGMGQRSGWMTSSDLATSTMTWLENLSKGAVKPIGSGISGIDRLIGGFYPGELTIIGAKPGVGKTVFGMVLAINAAQSGKKVGVMNLEMLDTQYGTRMVSSLGGVDAMKLRMGKLEKDDWQDITQAILKLSQLNCAYMFTSRFIEDLASAVREKGDIDLLVVDYLQLVRTRQKLESERLRMAHISWALKELAVDLRIPVIAMSQLRRPESGGENKMPSMRDLRESGNLEADADGIILLHEPVSADDPYVYKDDKGGFDHWKKAGLRYICMKVEKQRQGAVGTVPVLFEANKMRYLGIERDRK